MITKEEVKIIAEDYLERSSLKYSAVCKIEEINLIKSEEIPFGINKGKIMDVYFFHFAQLWGMEERGLSICIEASSGELQYIITPHDYIEIENLEI